MRRQVHRSVCAIIALGAAAYGVLSGCSARGPVPARPRDPLVGDQGGQWEAVFLPVSTRAAVDELAPGRERDRRDAALSVRGPRVVLASAQWPEPVRDTLERPRRVNLPDDADELLFFRPRRPYGARSVPDRPVYDGRVWYGPVWP